MPNVKLWKGASYWRVLGRVFSVSCQFSAKTQLLALQHARGQLLVQCGCSITAAEQRLPAVEPAKQELARFPPWW